MAIRERDLVLQAVVTWVNPRQQHPVHSLPPGFGVKFPSLEAADRRRIESIVDEYVARNPPSPPLTSVLRQRLADA